MEETADFTRASFDRTLHRPIRIDKNGYVKDSTSIKHSG